MAKRNNAITKLRKQRAQWRRGVFASFKPGQARTKRMEKSTLSEDYIAQTHVEQQFWSQHGATAMLGYGARARVNSQQRRLDLIFPGVQMQSEERAFIEHKLEEMQGFLDPISYVTLSRTENTGVYLLYNDFSSEAYIVERIRTVVRISCNYGTRDKAKNLYTQCRKAIRWREATSFTITPSTLR